MVEPGRESWRLEQDRPAVDPRGRAAHVTFLPRHLDGQPGTAQHVGSDHDGVDACSEVVHVRDRHDLDADFPQGVKRAGRSERLDEVTVPGAVERDATVRLSEQRTVALEAKRDELGEPQRLG